MSETLKFTGGCGRRGRDSEQGGPPWWRRSQWQVRAVSCSPGLWALHAGAAATATSRCPIIYCCSSSLAAGNLAAVSEPHWHGPRRHLSRIQMYYRLGCEDPSSSEAVLKVVLLCNVMSCYKVGGKFESITFWINENGKFIGNWSSFVSILKAGIWAHFQVVQYIEK